MEHKLEPVFHNRNRRKALPQSLPDNRPNLTRALFNIDPLNDRALDFQTKALQKIKTKMKLISISGICGRI